MVHRQHQLIVGGEITVWCNCELFGTTTFKYRWRTYSLKCNYKMKT